MTLRVTEEEYQALARRSDPLLARARVITPVKSPRVTDRRITVDGQVFGSKGEYGYYLVLRHRELAGEISQLQKQVEIPIVIHGEHVCSYRADYVYMDKGVQVVVDYKGLVTEMYALKKKLLAAVYGMRIEEVRKRQR